MNQNDIPIENRIKKLIDTMKVSVNVIEKAFNKYLSTQKEEYLDKCILMLLEGRNGRMINPSFFYFQVKEPEVKIPYQVPQSLETIIYSETMIQYTVEFRASVSKALELSGSIVQHKAFEMIENFPLVSPDLRNAYFDILVRDEELQEYGSCLNTPDEKRIFIAHPKRLEREKKHIKK